MCAAGSGSQAGIPSAEGFPHFTEFLSLHPQHLMDGVLVVAAVSDTGCYRWRTAWCPHSGCGQENMITRPTRLFNLVTCWRLFLCH